MTDNDDQLSPSFYQGFTSKKTWTFDGLVAFCRVWQSGNIHGTYGAGNAEPEHVFHLEYNLNIKDSNFLTKDLSLFTNVDKFYLYPIW